MGLNSSLSSPTSEQVCKKGGGGARSTDGSTPCNRMMIFDHSQGLPTSGSSQALKEIVHYLT